MRNSDSGTNAMVERYLKRYEITKEKLNVIAYTECSQSESQFVVEGIGVSILNLVIIQKLDDYPQLKIIFPYKKASKRNFRRKIPF